MYNIKKNFPRSNNTDNAVGMQILLEDFTHHLLFTGWKPELVCFSLFDLKIELGTEKAFTIIKSYSLTAIFSELCGQKQNKP